jgi:hypothetical protein
MLFSLFVTGWRGHANLQTSVVNLTLHDIWRYWLS